MLWANQKKGLTMESRGGREKCRPTFPGNFLGYQSQLRCLLLFALGRRGRTTNCLATHGSCEAVEALLLSPAACVAEMSSLEFAREELRDLPSSGVWSQPLV